MSSTSLLCTVCIKTVHKIFIYTETAVTSSPQVSITSDTITNDNGQTERISNDTITNGVSPSLIQASKVNAVAALGLSVIILFRFILF